MDLYRGVASSDPPTGGGTYVKEHGFGHEAFNYEPIGGEYLGYVQPQGSGINLGRLGGGKSDTHLDGVTVVWVATHPKEGGTRIIGWYRDARVFADFQDPAAREGRELPSGEVARFLVRSSHALRLPPDERLYKVPRGKGGMGQSNVWYPAEEQAAPILKYIADYERGRPTAKRGSSPRLQDVERRLRIEKRAMKATSEWFAALGYEVIDVSMDHVGWDLEARTDSARLKLEVKGTSLGEEEFVVEVTPNEYAKMRSDEHRDAYRLCVVTSCEDAPVVAVFAWSEERRAWIRHDGERRLEIEEILAARMRGAGV